MFILDKKNVKLQYHNEKALPSLVCQGGLLLVAKVRRVCCPSSLIVLAERTGQVMSGELWNKYVRCSLKLLLLLFAEIKIRYSLNNPNSIPRNEWGPSVDISRSHHRCLIGPHQDFSRSVPRTLLWDPWDPFSLIKYTAVSECLAQSEVLSCLDQVFICSFQLSLTL